MATDNDNDDTPAATRRRVLLVGWDAADWKFALPLLEAGGLPALASLVERGVMGNIATLQPPLSPLLWTSIATGKTADKHGVFYFLEPDRLNPELGVRPVSVTSRRSKALWNLLDARGLDAHVVGWYASHPAETLRGVSVSNRFFEPQTVPPGAAWTPPPGSVSPGELLAPLGSLVTQPEQIGDGQLREFLPDLDRIDRAVDRRPALLAEQLARTASVQAVATAILQNEPWDFLGVYFDGIDVLGHHFMPYHPPQMAGISERDFALYAGVMTRVYQFHDLMLARLLQLAGPDATVIVVSDHGFHCDAQRPAITGEESPMALDAAWHRTLGLFCAGGPGLKRDERVYGASVLDVAPTVLTLFGLPVGEDMDGRVVVGAFEEPPPIQRVPTWEDGQPPATAAAEVSPVSASAPTDRAAIEQLVALGYLDPLSGDAQRNADNADYESRFTLAVVYLSTRRAALALPLLESLHAERPEDGRITLQLAQCLHDLGRAADCAALLDERSALETGDPAMRAILLGSALLTLGRAGEAQQHFADAERLAPGHAGPSVLRGDAFLATREWDHAEDAFRRAIVLDGDHAPAHDGLATVHLEKRRYYEAAQSALEAVGRVHFFPAAHFRLGLALVGLGDYPRALQAFETSLAMAPNHRDAHRWAATLHRRLGNRAKAAEHRQAAEALAGSKP